MPVSNAEKAVFAKGLKGSSPPKRRFATSTAKADSWFTAATTSTIWPLRPPLRSRSSSSLRRAADPLPIGRIPDRPSSADEFAEPVDEFLRRLPSDVSPMAALEAAVAFAGLYDTEGDTVASAHHKSVRLIARVPTMVAAIGRLRQGKDPVPPNTNLSLAANSCGCLRVGRRRLMKPMR